MTFRINFIQKFVQMNLHTIKGRAAVAYLQHSFLTSKNEMGCEALSYQQEWKKSWRSERCPIQFVDDTRKKAKQTLLQNSHLQNCFIDWWQNDMLSEAGNSKANYFCSCHMHCDVQSQYGYNIQIRELRTLLQSQLQLTQEYCPCSSIQIPNINVE